MTTTTIHNPQERVYLGQAVYTKSLLAKYDAITRFSAMFLWQCSWNKLLKLYQNVSGNHLEVGVGSGYFLDQCRFPVDKPQITLLDLNPNSLEFTAKRIQRYQPTTHITNVLEPIALEPNQFDSIGFNYVIHCLPGTIATKAVAFKHLKPLMREGAILFGSTILGEGVKHNYVGNIAMEIYNNTGVFSNWQDKLSDLEAAL
ncbi:MAG: class I SAM-dependent methyltransferase, partial [Cyanobacteriota bacterium]